MIQLSAAVLVLLVFLQGGFLDATEAYKTRLRYGQHDALFFARCEARCWYMNNKSSCIKSCLQTPFEKPGQCPQNNTILSPFDAVCLDSCRQDFQCSGLTKCCRHSCGVTCQYPEELLSAVEVPNIPRDIKVMEGSKKRTVQIQWKPERHHAGHNFIEEHLSEWFPCARTIKTTHKLRNFVKPGRWYQFRVAAVNANGCKGFSENSPTFGVSLKPKPPKAPENVTVSALWTDVNGTLACELRWLPPRSDLPIQRYKIFWSRRLHGVKALDSVLVHQRMISKEQSRFLLQDLQPNSLYFLQIQALSQFGKSRLKGQKSGLVLNTTNYTNDTHIQVAMKPTAKNKIEGLRVQKIYWSHDGLRARIVWDKAITKESLKYTLSLWTGSCYNSKYCNNFKLAATTKASHFDLYDLQFNCRYRVSVRKVSDEGMKSMEENFVNFITPSCHDFKRMNQRVRCTN